MENPFALTRAMGTTCAALMLAACAISPSSGPSSRSIDGANQAHHIPGADIQMIDVTDEVARNILANSRQPLFSEELGESRPIGSVIGKGDVLDIEVWEAPPAALFGSANGPAQLIASGSTARGTSFPEQMVDSEGRVTIPFAGRILADGRTPQEIARDITSRLIGKAHQPQVIVRLAKNATANVTVVGDVASNARVPLTSRGERILDILAAVGGAKQPVDKTTIQISRGQTNVAMPMEAVVRNPSQNVRLQPDDVMTVLYQPFSFTALGAIGRNAEIPFEATGLTLAQALGRISGLQDTRADVKGVFIFRMEDPKMLDPSRRAEAKVTPDGKVPVIYRIDMKDPATFFIAQSFPIRDHDVLYVSNAPLADIQKFVNVIFSTILPAASTATLLK